MTIARWLPGLNALRTYNLAFVPHDIAAGLTLGAVMVPVGLAYGELAGLPLAGLYGSMLPLLAYALFGSSRQLIVGPDSAMATLVAVALVPLSRGDPARMAMLAADLSIMVGVLCLLGGALRLGFIANFLSKPVIVGFMHGLALVIVGAQLPKVLGIKAEGATTLEQFASIAERLGDTNLISLAIGAGTFALILLSRRFVPRLPGAVVALALAGLAVALLGADRLGVALVGRIPSGLPSFTLPVPSLIEFDDLLPIAFVAALLSFSDTMITARAFAARNRYQIDANQELIALGVANLASGVTRGLPISASDSRTAVAEAAGSHSQLTSIVAAGVIVVVMLWLADFLYYLPMAALGGVLMAAAWGLCEFHEFRRLWRFRGVELAGVLLTMVGVVVFDMMEGILLGVVFSIVLLLRAFAFPPDALLGRSPDGEWHDPAYRPEATPVPGLLVYRFSAPLIFANCKLFRERIQGRLAKYPAKAVVIDCGAIHDVDLMAVDMLIDLEGELSARGIKLVFGALRDRVKRDIERGLPTGSGGEELVFPSVRLAAESILLS
jgi:high affinity sulfate transporter 1